MEIFIALLRGINVGGHNPLAMPELRALCSSLGWQGVGSYINSGNLVFSAAGAPAQLEGELESAIQGRFGLSISVIVRAAAGWSAYLSGNPFPEAAQSEPNLVALVLSKAEPKPGAAEALQERASMGERVAQVGAPPGGAPLSGGAIWIYYRGGAGRSKLSPGLLERLIGSPATARNWRTVLKIHEMAEAALSPNPPLSPLPGTGRGE